MAGDGYAGDIRPKEAWDILQKDPAACLIDVRTDAEWRYVGVPKLDALGKPTHCVCWQVYPDNNVNDRFVEQVKDQGVRPDQTVLLLCRSGQRSKNAAIALTAAGFKCCYNVAEGFEGDRDGVGHRGTVGGWKVAGLPWGQG
ncbi:MAG: rhodanese-like domain-containing protein [Alphaproteobacteria bacterium]|nr:rhodanese-like domain-containing protein [Alphaproteobacteria bacterium]